MIYNSYSTLLRNNLIIVKIRLQFMKFSLYIIETLPIYVDIHKKIFKKMSTHDPQIMNSYHHKKFHSIFFFAHNSPQGDVMKVCKDIGRRCNFELYTYQHQYCKMPNLNGKLGRYLYTEICRYIYEIMLCA